MKLLFAKRSFTDYGGAECYLTTLLHAIANEECHLFAAHWKEIPGVTWRPASIWPLGPIGKTYSFQRSLHKELQTNRYDCVISFERLVGADLYRASDGCHARWLELRSVHQQQWKRYSFALNPMHRYLCRLEREIFEQTPKIITNSQMVRKEIEERFRTQSITVIYNGVDLHRFSPPVEPTERREKRILFVGTGFERKGLKKALEALSHLKDPEITLHVIGKGDPAPFRAFIQKHHLEHRVHFLGTLSQIEKAFREGDLFLLPTLYDPFSNATLEAMACGLPIVTSSTNGAAELIKNGEEGFVCDLQDPPSRWAEVIALSLKERVAIGSKARATACHYPIEAAVEQFHSAIKMS